MPQIGISILSTELGVILLSIVQQVGYDCATEKVVEAFVLGKDVFIQTKSDCPSRGPGSSRITHKLSKELEFHG